MDHHADLPCFNSIGLCSLFVIDLFDDLYLKEVISCAKCSALWHTACFGLSRDMGRICFLHPTLLLAMDDIVLVSITLFHCKYSPIGHHIFKLLLR